MTNVTPKAGISSAKKMMVALTIGAGTVALPAQAAFALDTTEIVAAAAIVLTSLTAVGVAFIMVPVAIKGFASLKAMIFRS